MLGLGGDNEDDQRLWNFLIFKVPVTDKELEEIDESVSFWWIIIIILIIIGGLVCLVTCKNNIN